MNAQWGPGTQVYVSTTFALRFVYVSPDLKSSTMLNFLTFPLRFVSVLPEARWAVVILHGLVTAYFAKLGLTWLLASCRSVLCRLKHHGRFLFHLRQIIRTGHFRSSQRYHWEISEIPRSPLKFPKIEPHIPRSTGSNPRPYPMIFKHKNLVIMFIFYQCTITYFTSASNATIILMFLD